MRLKNWRQMLELWDTAMKAKRLVWLIAALSVAAAALVIGVGWLLGSSQPGAKEYEAAQAIVRAAREAKGIAGSGADVLFEVSRNRIVINVYGVLDDAAQAEVERLARQTFEATDHTARLELSFFPPRVFVNEIQNGTQVRVLQKRPPIKTVEINRKDKKW